MLTAALLLFAGITNNSMVLFFVLLLAMIFHMPTWSLTSSIAMSHSPSELFPRIRVFGSIGWVLSGVCSLIAVKVLNLDFDGTNVPFYFAAGIGLITTGANLTLPKTPPQAQKGKISLIDALGFRSLILMKDRNFATFIVISFLAMIPFSMYWSYCSEFLLNQNFKYISLTMNLGQLAEMFFVLTVPFIIRKAGLRLTMIIGLVVLSVRYLSFFLGVSATQPSLYFLGILVHGIIYGYFFLGGQIYIDKKTPKELRAQAQGFIFFVTFGVGLLVGNFVSGKIISLNKSIGVYDWETIWGITTFISVALTIAMILFFKKEKEGIHQKIASTGKTNIPLNISINK